MRNAKQPAAAQVDLAAENAQLRAALASLEARVNQSQPKPAAAPVAEDTFGFRDMLSMAGVELPSWKRTLVGLIAAGVGGYLIGTVGGTLMNILTVGAIAVTGSMFLATCLWVLALIVTIYAAWKVGAWAFSMVVSKRGEDKVVEAKDKVIGWLRPREASPVTVAAV